MYAPAQCEDPDPFSGSSLAFFLQPPPPSRQRTCLAPPPPSFPPLPMPGVGVGGTQLFSDQGRGGGNSLDDGRPFAEEARERAWREEGGAGKVRASEKEEVKKEGGRGDVLL